MPPFIHIGAASRIVFGQGSLCHLSREVDMLGGQRALILSTPGHAAQAERVAAQLGSRTAGIHAQAVMHVPIESAARACAEAKRVTADCVVAIGGGSAIGLAKATALETGLPIVAIPTTYAGSEVTSVYGLTENGIKRTGKDSRVLPRTVIYDPTLTLTLSPLQTVTSGMNAIAHSAEGLYSREASPLMSLMAEEGIRAIASSLPALHDDPKDIEARSTTQYGAWLCGAVLGGVGMALHHKLCHTLGGTFNLPHAEVHTVILPQAIAYNAEYAPAAMARISRALTAGRPAAALYDLARANGAPLSLREIGMKASDLDRAAELAVANPYWNPAPVEISAIRALLHNAWDGARPE